MKVIDSLIRKTKVFTKLLDKLYQTEIQRDALIKENLELQERVFEISRKLCNVTIQRPPDGIRNIRICLAFDQRIIEEGLLHGNDDRVIEYIGVDIGRRAAYEIRRANFQRWEI